MSDTPTGDKPTLVDLNRIPSFLVKTCECYVPEAVAYQLEHELAVAMDAIDECRGACIPARNETGEYIYNALVDVLSTLRTMRRAYEEGQK